MKSDLNALLCATLEKENMVDKVHQSNTSEYQIRIDGKPVYWNGCISKHTFNKYRELCRDNPDCYVDVVRVSTDIICNQRVYNEFKHHFDGA